MEKKVISFMNTKLVTIVFILIISLYSCNSKNEFEEIAVIQVSGAVYQKLGVKKIALTQASFLSKNTSNSEIVFESGFAILQLDSLQIILPKGTKRTYSISDIFDEFNNKDGNVNARYAKYVSEKLFIDHGKTKEDQTTKGVVSRGAKFLHARNPSTGCSVLEDNICFSWDTNLMLDTLQIHVIDNLQRTIGNSISLPKNSSKQVSKEDLGITSGGRYYWQITKKDEYPNYNAWKAFNVASQEEISEFKSFYSPELNLSEDTKKAIIESISCGCGF